MGDRRQSAGCTAVHLPVRNLRSVRCAQSFSQQRVQRRSVLRFESRGHGTRERVYFNAARESELFTSGKNHPYKAAGSGVFLDSDSYTLIDVDENVPEAATLAVRISGDSMTPLFNNGQIVYVHHQQELENGEIGIFVLNGEAFCKKLDSESGSVRLISLNPKYQPIKIKYSYELRVIGKVVG